MESQDRVVKISLLAGLGVVLYTVENFLPTPFPWLRIGISNVAILLALYTFGFRGALWVFGLKILLGSFIAGRLFSPFFFFALGGGGVSLMIMGIAKRLFSPPLSIVGVSMLGGVSHNITQLFIAYLLLFPYPQLLFLVPILTLLGLATGSIIGIISLMVLKRLEWKRREYA